MAQTVPFDAFLGISKSGQAIGCIIYQLNGTTVHAAFATTGWYESPAGSGAYHHAGLSLPDAGGVVAVGVSGTEYQRLAIGADPAAAVWSASTRTLTSFGTLVADVAAAVWAAAVRTLGSMRRGSPATRSIRLLLAAVILATIVLLSMASHIRKMASEAYLTPRRV